MPKGHYDRSKAKKRTKQVSKLNGVSLEKLEKQAVAIHAKLRLAAALEVKRLKMRLSELEAMIGGAS